MKQATHPSHSHSASAPATPAGRERPAVEQPRSWIGSRLRWDADRIGRMVAGLLRSEIAQLGDAQLTLNQRASTHDRGVRESPGGLRVSMLFPPPAPGSAAGRAGLVSTTGHVRSGRAHDLALPRPSGPHLLLARIELLAFGERGHAERAAARALARMACIEEEHMGRAGLAPPAGRAPRAEREQLAACASVPKRREERPRRRPGL